MADDKKPPIRLYEQRLRFTPNGTQFSNQVTKEGREHFDKLQAAKMEKELTEGRKENVGVKFNSVARIRERTKTRFKRAAKKDRGDFER